MKINVVLNWQIEVVGVPDEDYTSEQEDQASVAVCHFLDESLGIEATMAVDFQTPEPGDDEVNFRIDLTGALIEEAIA